MADTFYYSGPVVGGRDDALFAISNLTDPETEDRRRTFRLKSLNLTPMNFVAAPGTVSCGMVFGRFQGACEGGEVIPVTKLDSAAPDLPSGIQVLTGSTIGPGYASIEDINNFPSFFVDFSEFAFGSRYLNNVVPSPTAASSLNMPTVGGFGLAKEGTAAILTNTAAAPSTTVGVQLVQGGFAFAIKTQVTDTAFGNVWNAHVKFTVNSDTYFASFHFISYGTSLGLNPNDINVLAPQSTTVPFVIYTTMGSSHVIEIKSVNMMALGTVNTTATPQFIDQPNMRICRTTAVAGGVAVSPVPANTSVAAPSQLGLAVNRDPYASLTAGLSLSGVDLIGDLGYPSANQGIVRRINIFGRRQTLPAVRNSVFVGSTPNFGNQSLRGWEWSYDNAPLISPGQALTLIQENASAYGGWWVDAVIWSDPPPAAVGGGESSYAFIG